jgi:hypothetical protein
MIIEGAVNVYIPPHCGLSPAELESPKSIDSLMFNHAPAEGRDDFFAKAGYTLVGTATITIALMDRDTLVSNKIDALRNEAAGIRAEATKKCTEIEGKIQQLLCIENRAVPSFAEVDDIPF